jgi:hypothetical protein
MYLVMQPIHLLIQTRYLSLQANRKTKTSLQKIKIKIIILIRFSGNNSTYFSHCTDLREEGYHMNIRISLQIIMKRNNAAVTLTEADETEDSANRHNHY